jgi:O-antigen/teichoic acid export membrane protein
MLPRMSSILADRRFDEFKRLLKKSLLLLLLIFIPVSVLMAIFAPEIIRILAGPGYEGAILPLQIISPLLIIIGIEQIIIIQGLMPLGKDKAVLANSFAGAVTGIALNIWLVPEYGAIGSAIAWFASECAVLTSALLFFRKAIKKN